MSQKRDLGHPLKVWTLQLDFHQKLVRNAGLAEQVDHAGANKRRW
jgi:hypothetical protein